jgi:alginate O-acetyltransferase complex protein AlgJ
VGAVLDFSKQLETRGIRLVVLPAPVKPMVEGHWMSGEAPGLRVNRSYAKWLEILRAQGVDVLDVAGDLVKRERDTGAGQYLLTDTHWRPESMQAVAARVAERVRGVANLREEPASGAPVREMPREVFAHGDTLALLGLPEQQSLFQKEPVKIAPVSFGGRVWRGDPSAEVLVLGDSFTNIYSLGALGWGESAGFAEQLSVELGRPVDVLARNSDGAFATRAMLQRELAAGRDRLRGKRVVVWEFAARELAFGDWRFLSMTLGKPGPTEFFEPKNGRSVRVQGTVGEVASIPQPGSVPYREHIVSVRLLDVQVEGQPAENGRQALVYSWSMRERELTAVARMRLGDRVEFQLRAWEEVSGELEKFQRSEFADPTLVAEPVAWGDWVGSVESGR